MQLKDTVRLQAVLPQTVLAALISETVFQRVGCVGAVITSCNDSEHGGHPVAGEDKDPHYTGRAIDLRVRHVAKDLRSQVFSALRDALGNEYRLLWESVGTDNEHFHVQYEGMR